VEIDPRVTRRYEAIDEDARLWQPGRGDLVRLRTWDILARVLPPSGRVLDVGGGPGTHAAHLAGRGYDVTLLDPVPRHVEQASRRAADPSAAAFTARLGSAGDLPVADGSADAVLLLGPLYHLVERADRLPRSPRRGGPSAQEAGSSSRSSAATPGRSTPPCRASSTRRGCGATSSALWPPA
jgi:SAM-dependent methyltransferase